MMGQPAQVKQLLEEQQQQETDRHFDELLLLAAESTSAQVIYLFHFSLIFLIVKKI